MLEQRIVDGLLGDALIYGVVFNIVLNYLVAWFAPHNCRLAPLLFSGLLVLQPTVCRFTNWFIIKARLSVLPWAWGL